MPLVSLVLILQRFYDMYIKLCYLCNVFGALYAHWGNALVNLTYHLGPTFLVDPLEVYLPKRSKKGWIILRIFA